MTNDFTTREIDDMTTFYEEKLIEENPEKVYQPTTEENCRKWARLQKDMKLKTPAGMCHDRGFVLYCLKEPNAWVRYVA